MQIERFFLRRRSNDYPRNAFAPGVSSLAVSLIICAGDGQFSNGVFPMKKTCFFFFLITAGSLFHSYLLSLSRFLFILALNVFCPSTCSIGLILGVQIFSIFPKLLCYILF